MRKFLHINKVVLIVLFVMCGLFQNVCVAAQQSTWDGLTSSTVAKYAPSLVSAGVGAYGLHNLLSRGISRDNIYAPVMALGLAASPILANYALYHNEQQLHANSPEYLQPANKLRFAVPSLSLVALLALHGGYRNFWSTAPYQAALATAGLILPGAISTNWFANTEKKESAKRVLLAPEVVDKDISEVKQALYDLGSDQRLLDSLAKNLTVESTNNLLSIMNQNQKALGYDQVQKLLYILRKPTHSVSAMNEKTPTEGDLGKIEKLLIDFNTKSPSQISEGNFRALLEGLYSLVKHLRRDLEGPVYLDEAPVLLPRQLKSIVRGNPEAIRNLLDIISMRQAARSGNPHGSPFASEMYGSLTPLDLDFLTSLLEINLMNLKDYVIEVPPLDKPVSQPPLSKEAEKEEPQRLAITSVQEDVPQQSSKEDEKEEAVKTASNQDNASYLIRTEIDDRLEALYAEKNELDTHDRSFAAEPWKDPEFNTRMQKMTKIDNQIGELKQEWINTQFEKDFYPGESVEDKIKRKDNLKENLNDAIKKLRNAGVGGDNPQMQRLSGLRAYVQNKVPRFDF